MKLFVWVAVFFLMLQLKTKDYNMRQNVQDQRLIFYKKHQQFLWSCRYECNLTKSKSHDFQLFKNAKSYNL